jgi:glucan 1,3-beta-glucosidase
MMFLQTVVAAALGLSTLTPIFAINPGFPYGSQKVRGVNLGGWLVLEVCINVRVGSVSNSHPRVVQPWITPSLFDNTGDSRIIDEWTFGQYQDHNKALATLQHHWDTWITEADFSAIAAAGYEHALRIEVTVS